MAIQGLAADGNEFVEAARKKGAAAVVSEQPPPDAGALGAGARRPRGPGRALGRGSSPTPAATSTWWAITGTNGKTTTAYMIDSAIREAGETGGLLGTVEYRIGDRVAEAVRTTPEASDLQSLLREMVDGGCQRAVLEVSSHSLALSRVHGLEFAVAVFTNLTRDHLDYHGDMESYFAAKRVLFDSLLREDGRAVINVDDDHGAELARTLDRQVWTCSSPAGRRLHRRGRAAVPGGNPFPCPDPLRGSSRCRRPSSGVSASRTRCAPSGRATPSACPPTRSSAGWPP